MTGKLPDRTEFRTTAQGENGELHLALDHNRDAWVIEEIRGSERKELASFPLSDPTHRISGFTPGEVSLHGALDFLLERRVSP